MKLIALLRLVRFTINHHFVKITKHKHDNNEGCEFLDEPVHMYNQEFEDTELGNY